MRFALFLIYELTPILLSMAAVRCYWHKGWREIVRPVFLLGTMLLASATVRVFVFASGAFWGIAFDEECPFDGGLCACLAFDALMVAVVWLLGRLMPRNTVERGSYAVSGMSCFHRLLATGLTLVLLIHFLISNSVFFCAPIEFEDPGEFLFAVAYFGLFAILMDLYYFSGRVVWIWRMDMSQREAQRSIASLRNACAPIVLLRSFEVDRHTFLGASLDEFLCRALVRTGAPVVSLGDPKGVVPTGGSIKIQATNEHWQEVVTELLKVSRAVVMVEGLTEGLQWEIENMKRYVPPSRFFVVTLPNAYRLRVWQQAHTMSMLLHILFFRKSMRQTFDYVWAKFRSYMKGEGFDVCEADPGGGKLLTFDSNWRVDRVLAPRSSRDLVLTAVRLVDDAGPVLCDFEALAKNLSKYIVDRSAKARHGIRFRFVSGLAFVCVLLLAVAGCLACIWIV